MAGFSIDICCFWNWGLDWNWNDWKECSCEEFEVLRFEAYELEDCMLLREKNCSFKLNQVCWFEALCG